MSVAVSRQPTFSPITTPHRRMPAPRAPSAPATIVPGLIRLQAGTTTTSPQRNPRPRQRKQQNRQSQDGTPHAFSQVDTPRDSSQPDRSELAADSAPASTLPSVKERASPKRASQQAQGRHPQHQAHQQHQSAKKLLQQQQPKQQPLPATAQHRSPPRSPTRARHNQHARSQRHHEARDLSLSSADDSDDALPPVEAPSSRVASAPTAVAAEPAGRLARSRKNLPKDKGLAPGFSIGAGAVSEPTFSTTPSASIPIARHGRSGHTRAATTTDPFISRSVPLSSALPDWDLPISFSASSSNSSSSDLTTTLATNMQHFSHSTSQLPAPSSFSQQPPRPSARPTVGAPVSEERILVPWIDTLEDEYERAAAVGASAPLMTRPARAGINGSPAPSTPSRPVRRHARTASVPSMGSHHVFTASPASTPSSRAEPSGMERANKYANGRFQSAPAPTFLPMPSFQA